jgi:hypothetical protein
VLEHSQHAQFALLVDQGVVGNDGEVEVQASGDPDGVNDVVLPNLIHYVHPLGDLAKDGMNSVEMRLGSVTDEELAATSVLPRVRHGERAGYVLVSVEMGLAFDLVSRSAGPYSRIVGVLRERIATLNHEVGNDPVESSPIVKLGVGQLLEVAYGARHFSVEQLGFDGAFAGLDSCALGHG